ncbi:LysR family transcriptional regulator [Amycolatopsis pittospori]|uniref:LysR family transcriptional regulator n=1 Tax=Amycolatopsis pittospori TaxID=2749434 RepID=UPI0015EFDEC9|nr:LysR family transcriptional regulator [Amycolatopsis pittospori]
MEVEVRHLRVIVAIAEAGSVNRAARQLGVSQPTLVGQLRRIERALGGALFLRAESGSSPTPFGHHVLNDAYVVMRGLQSIQREAQARRADGFPGTAARIGGRCGFAQVELVRWMTRTGWGHGARLQVRYDPQAAVDEVADGTLDLAVIHDWPGFGVRVPDGLREVILVPDEPVLVIMDPEHPLADHDIVRVESVAEHPWLDEPAGVSHWLAYLHHVGHQRGVTFEQRHEVLSDVAAFALLSGSRSIAPASATFLAREEKLALRGLAGNPLRQRLLAVYRRRSSIAAHIEEICAHIIEIYHRRRECNDYFNQWWLEEGSSTVPTF